MGALYIFVHFCTFFGGVVHFLYIFFGVFDNVQSVQRILFRLRARARTHIKDTVVHFVHFVLFLSFFRKNVQNVQKYYYIAYARTHA